MIITLLILVMLWLVSCALCTAAGFFVGQNYKKPKPIKEPELTEAEKRRIERERKELENFFLYDGSEQLTHESVNK